MVGLKNSYEMAKIKNEWFRLIYIFDKSKEYLTVTVVFVVKQIYNFPFFLFVDLLHFCGLPSALLRTAM